MSLHFQILTLLLSIIFTNSFTQSKEWITKKSDDGSVMVKSCISESKNKSGDLLPLIEYTATATLSVNMQNCISVLKDISKHKAFLRDAKESKMIKLLPNNQTVVYYGFKAPWPFSDYDCVTIMSLTEVNNSSIFTLSSAPSMYKSTDDDRLTDYEISYRFKDLKNGKTEITIIGKMSPLIKIPLWMLRRTMPEHPAETIHKIVTLANEILK